MCSNKRTRVLFEAKLPIPGDGDAVPWLQSVELAAAAPGESHADSKLANKFSSMLVLWVNLWCVSCVSPRNPASKLQMPLASLTVSFVDRFVVLGYDRSLELKVFIGFPPPTIWKAQSATD